MYPSQFSFAEEVRFELTAPVKRLLFSRQVRSTTLPLLRIRLFRMDGIIPDYSVIAIMSFI